MHFRQLILSGFGSLPDQQVDLDSGVNIIMDTTHSWHGILFPAVTGVLFGLPDDARARLLAGSDSATAELACGEGSNEYRLTAILTTEGEAVQLETSSLRRSGDGTSDSIQLRRARREHAATSDTLAALAHDIHPTLSETSWLVTDLQSEFEQAIRRLGAERQETSGLLDALNLKSLRDRAAQARRLVSEISQLEKELRSDPVMDRSLSDDVAAAKSIDSHISSLTKVISMKKAKLEGLAEELASGRDKLEFYEYLKGIGVNDVNSVKRALERKRWLKDDLEKLETEIELGAKRLEVVSGMVRKYDRLKPFLGSREMELDRLEDQLEKLQVRMPTEKLQKAEAERRAVRAQIQYWRTRRFIAALGSVVPVLFAFLLRPIALLSVVGLALVFRYWREVSALVQKMTVVVDRLDYLVLERNEIAAQIRSVQRDIEAIHNQTGTTSAAELHDKIEDYQRLLSELGDLKRKAAERERARDELRRKLREEEQRAGVLFDRVGLSTGLDEATVHKFAEMVSRRMDDERSLKELERRIEDEQLEMEGLLRQVKVLQKRLDQILTSRGVKSVSELQQLCDAADSQDARHKYKKKSEELQQLLNGQRLADLEARIDMLSHLVPDDGKAAELPSGVTRDQLEARLESIRIRSDLLKWLKGSALPVLIEGLDSQAIGDLERRQACVDLCWMSRTRQLLVLVADDSWESAIRSVADNLGVPVRTVRLSACN